MFYNIFYLHLPVVEGLIFCISATPHLGTSFPLFHVTSADTGHCVVTAGGDGAQQLRPVRVLQRQAAPQHLRQHHDQVRPTDRQPYKCTKVTKEITWNCRIQSPFHKGWKLDTSSLHNPSHIFRPSRQDIKFSPTWSYNEGDHVGCIHVSCACC